MKWVPITDYDDKINKEDEPRLLKQEEINYIINHLPLVPAADHYCADLNRKNIMEFLSEQLRNVKICPSAIDDLAKMVVESHNKALITPNTPIGITAAEAFGAVFTQMTLNSVAPWEQILIQDINGKVLLTKIGDWIDDLINNNVSKVQHFPENRTQYLELENPYFIATPDKNGIISWDKITAITKHLPVGDMVKITTQTEKTVTATQSKSLLKWNGQELIQIEGSNIKVGDYVPILANIPAPPKVFDTLDNVVLTKNLGEKFSNYIFNHIGGEEIFEKWFNNGILAPEILFANDDFLEGLLRCEDFQTATGHLAECRDYIERRLKRKSITVNDIMLDLVINVEMVPATEYVYDLTIPTTTNFSLWNGLGVADTFHTSGAAKSAYFGIAAAQNIIYARKNLKLEGCTIYFTDKTLTVEDVYNTQQYIVGSVFTDFVLSYDIDVPENFEKFWWHDTFPVVYGKKIPDSKVIMRLYLNIPEMYKHRVSIGKLASVFERENNVSIIAVHGSITDGIIDLFPITEMVNSAFEDQAFSFLKEDNHIIQTYAQKTYLEEIVNPELKTLRVKGIEKIKEVIPIIRPVWSIVILERKVEANDPFVKKISMKSNEKIFDKKDINKFWLLFLNKSTSKSTGINVFHLSNLCKLAGIETVGTNDEHSYMMVYMGNLKDSYYLDNNEIIYKIGDNYYHQVKIDDIISIGEKSYRKINYEVKKTKNGQWIINVSKDSKSIQLPDNSIVKHDNEYYLLFDTYINDSDDNEANIYVKLFSESPKLKINNMNPSKYVERMITKARNNYNNDLNIETQERKKEADKKYVEIYNLYKDNYDEEQVRLFAEQQKSFILNKKLETEKPKILSASEFVYAETVGSNLIGLMTIPGIDKTKISCNNMYTINSVLGIEVTRNFIIKSLNSTIANSSLYVHPAHLLFIAEFITNRGVPFGATYTGISRQPGGHLSLATLQKAGEVFISNALFSRKEDIRNVSASIVVGSRMTIGSGAFKIQQKIKVNGEDVVLVNDDVFDAFSKDDNYKNIVSAEDVENYFNYDSTNEPPIVEANFDLTSGYDDKNTDSNVIYNEIYDDQNKPSGTVNSLLNAKSSSVRAISIRKKQEIDNIYQPNDISSTGLITTLPSDIILKYNIGNENIPQIISDKITQFVIENIVEEQENMPTETKVVDLEPDLDLPILPDDLISQINENVSIPKDENLVNVNELISYLSKLEK